MKKTTTKKTTAAPKGGKAKMKTPGRAIDSLMFPVVPVLKKAPSKGAVAKPKKRGAC